MLLTSVSQQMNMLRWNKQAWREGFDSLSGYLRHLHATSQKPETLDSQIKETGMFYGLLDPTLFEGTD